MQGVSELIDSLRDQKMIRAITDARQSLIERCHPWPPVEKKGVVQQHPLSQEATAGASDRDAIVTRVMARIYGLSSWH